MLRTQKKVDRFRIVRPHIYLDHADAQDQVSNLLQLLSEFRLQDIGTGWVHATRGNRTRTVVLRTESLTAELHSKVVINIVMSIESNLT